MSRSSRRARFTVSSASVNRFGINAVVVSLLPPPFESDAHLGNFPWPPTGRGLEGAPDARVGSPVRRDQCSGWSVTSAQLAAQKIA